MSTCGSLPRARIVRSCHGAQAAAAGVPEHAFLHWIKETRGAPGYVRYMDDLHAGEPLRSEIELQGCKGRWRSPRRFSRSAGQLSDMSLDCENYDTFC